MTGPDSEVEQLARDVIGAAIEVHRCLGPGFLEEVIREGTLCREFEMRMGIPYSSGRLEVISSVTKGEVDRQRIR